MSYNFLDKSGLTYFWEKIKAKLDTKMNVSDMNKYNYSAESAGGTIDHLATFTSGKPGLTGSISLTKKSSGIGSEIPAGWYNFYFTPHRSGVGGDNGQYGTIILTPMNFSGKSWLLRRSGSTGAITEVKQLITSAENPILNNNSYINTHPENNPVLIPFIHNDIAFLTYRGGSRKVYYDSVEKDININNVFDGSPTYFGVNPTTTGVTEIVIELTLHKTFTWTNTIYCDFGANGWRAKTVKIEVMNTNYSKDVWTSKLNLTSNSSGNIKTTFTHTPVGASNAGGGFNKVRFTFSNFNSSTDFRIAQLGIYNYGSNGVRETYMSRGIDDYLFRNVTPNSNNTYNLGDSSHKWKDIHTKNLYLDGNDMTNLLVNNRRIKKDGSTSSATWYFPLVTLPIDNVGDMSSFLIDGRLGGYLGTDMSKYSIMITNRTAANTGDKITGAVLQFLNNTQTVCDIVAYAQTDKSAKVYIKVKGYFLFDFLYLNYQGTLTYDGTYSTTTPTGTLIWSLSTAPKTYIDNDGKLVNNNGFVGDLDGKATKDGDGNVISTTYYKASNPNGYTSNKGTVTSVAVKMNGTSKGTVTTSGTIDLGTVITAHQDISGKQDKLTTQTAYTSKGSATKVPQITTNTLGQVTGITEVTITQPTVNNGTLTIQKNGTNVQTFTANQSGNATANITVPTATSDLTNDSDFTTESNLLNSTTFKQAIVELIYPVGSLYITDHDDDDHNPNNLFPGTTWYRTCIGRALTGALDSEYTGPIKNNVNTFGALGWNGSWNSAFQNKSMGGQYVHALTVNEIPGHTHSTYIGGSNGSGYVGVNGSPVGTKAMNTATSSTGGGASHPVIQPYEAYMIWRRGA